MENRSERVGLQVERPVRRLLSKQEVMKAGTRMEEVETETSGEIQGVWKEERNW